MTDELTAVMHKGLKGEHMTPADEINYHLLKGGTVIVSTYTNAWKYTRKHAGMFYIGEDEELRVKSGKSSLCLSSCKGKHILVDIKLY